MSPAWQKRFLLVAAAWNVIGGATALLDPAGHFAQAFNGVLALDDPLQLFFYRCVWINVIAWGLGYLVAAYREESRAAILAAGATGKLAYFAASAAAYQAGVGKAALLAAGLFDVALAAGFVWILLGSGRAPSPAPALSGNGG